MGEVVRLEQALAAASKGISERIAARTSAGGLQVEAEADEAEVRADGLASVQAHRDVARLEDVLSVAPPAPSPAQPELEVKLPADEPASGGAPAQPEVARLEDVLSVAPPPAPVAPPSVPKVEPSQAQAEETKAEAAAPLAEAKPPTRVEMRAIAPRYVAAHALRAAFLFEQTAAFESSSASAEPEAPAPEVDVERHLAESQVVPGPPQVEVQPETAEPVAPGSQNQWLFALCVLALIALVIVLTCRKPRRASAQSR
ncbi:MAG: hypothetical protein JO244_03295 [Solirubrobacterales bacterium]|nr:hypothetical protein [Solirubrobacterales bacterium]